MVKASTKGYLQKSQFAIIHKGSTSSQSLEILDRKCIYWNAHSTPAQTTKSERTAMVQTNIMTLYLHICGLAYLRFIHYTASRVEPVPSVPYAQRVLASRSTWSYPWNVESCSNMAVGGGTSVTELSLWKAHRTAAGGGAIWRWGGKEGSAFDSEEYENKPKKIWGL